MPPAARRFCRRSGDVHPWRKSLCRDFGLANNFGFALRATPINCAMNASMLAELKKKQSGEDVAEPEPAPRLSSAAVAAAPGFTPWVRGIRTVLEGDPVEEVAAAEAKREEADAITKPELGRQVSGAL